MSAEYPYMYNNKANRRFEEEVKKKHERKSPVGVVEVENAVILPTKFTKERSWGLGGVIDKYGQFVEMSGIPFHYGGSYEYYDDEILYFDETIIFISVIPNHWGHFLADVVGRLWYCIDAKEKFRIAYTSYGFNRGKILGTFLEFFELLGINKESLILIDKPMKYKRVIIPERTMTSHAFYNDYSNYSIKYKTIIDRVIENVDKLNNDYPKYDKLYFTRMAYGRARYTDTGEKQICDNFRRNGFMVISPEKLTLKEQIYYIRNCKVMACLSGTLPHNVVFAKNDMELVICNRTGALNFVQIRLNEMFPVVVDYIDVYREESKNQDYGRGPFWIEANYNLENYFKANNMKYAKTTVLESFCNRIRFYIMKAVKDSNVIWNLVRKIRHVMKR